MPKYYIQCWIPVDGPDDDDGFDSEADAEREIESLALMQPENKYEVVCVDEDEDDSWRREIDMERF